MTKKKRKKFMVYSSLPNDLDIKQAGEIITVLDEMVADSYPKLKFEHLLLWWLSCAPADA